MREIFITRSFHPEVGYAVQYASTRPRVLNEAVIDRLCAGADHNLVGAPCPSLARPDDNRYCQGSVETPRAFRNFVQSVSIR